MNEQLVGRVRELMVAASIDEQLDLGDILAVVAHADARGRLHELRGVVVNWAVALALDAVPGGPTGR